MPVVVQIDAYDPVGGLPVTLRAGSVDEPGVCHLGDMLWWPALSKLPTLRYDLFDGSFAAQITAPTSSLTLQIEQWPDFGRYALANARIQLWTGAAGADWSAWTLRFDGRVSAQPKVAGAAASIDFGVDDSWLDAALLTTYAGTTGIEGPAELKGQAKPLALGAPRYVPGKLIDSINSVFQISAYGAIGGVEAALEKLARFSAPVGDRPSYASLVAADIPAGRWATCRASGLVRFGAPPEGLITFLAQGDIAGSDGWARTPGKLIRRLATLSGGAGKIDDASLNALDAARPYNLSLYVEEQTTARELIQRIAASCNAVAGVSWTGKLFVLPIGLGPASLTLSADGSTLPPMRSVEQIAIQAPWRKLAIGAERTWTVHALSDIAFTAALVDVGAYDAETTYREGNIVSLPDGSRWLYISTTPAAGHRPSAADADHWSNLNPATKAGDIVYDDGRTLEDLKPAEPGATNSADPNSPFGSGGKKVSDALQMMERVPQIAAQIEPMKTDVSALKDATVGHDAALGALGGRLTASEQEIAALHAVDGEASDALVALGTVVADQGAAQRQATRDVGRIEDALLRALMESARTRTVLRDAGIVVDPATGVVRIYAVDQLRDRTATAELAIDAVKATVSTKASVNYVDEQLALAVLDPSQVAELEPLIARMTQAESEIDGLNAKVALKASATDLTALTGRTRAAELTIDALGGAVAAKAESAVVDALGLRLGSAEQRLDALPDTTGYSIVVRQARGVADGAAEAGLRALLAGDAASRHQLTQIAQARQDLTATIVDGLSAEALARTALSVRVAESTALTLSESRASLARDAALTERIDAQAVAMDGQAAAIGRLDRAAIDAAGGIASSQMLIRQQIGAADQSDEALLRALLTGDAANRDQNAQLALIRTDFTTTLIANEQAAAVARQALLVRMLAAEAAIVTTSKALADTTGAYGSRIGAIELAFADPFSGLGATRLRIDAVEEGSATRDAALGRRTDAIVAQIDDPVKGLAATLALATATQTAQVDGDKALATRIDAQGAVLGDQAAAIGELRTASIAAGRGIAGVQMTIRQQVGAADEAGEALLRALIAGDDASRARAAQLVQVQTELSTTIVANELASAIARQALLARLGAAETAIVTTSKVQADATQALATRQAALETAFSDAATGLAATRARIVALEEAVANDKAATARRLDLLDASLVDPETGKAITGATVAADRRASVTRDEANASDLRQLSAEVNDPTLGLGATRAGLTALGEAVASDRAASAQTIQEVRASITATAVATAATAEEKRAEGEGRLKTDIDDNYDRVHGELADVDQARKSGDAANQALIQTVDGRVTDLARATADQNGVLAESIRQVSTTVGDHTTTISFLLRSLDGKEATAQLTIDANGKITGFVINGQQSVFAVAADKFIVGNSQIFEIDTATGQTVVNAIKAGIITAREIAAGAVQQTIFAVTDADIVIQYG